MPLFRVIPFFETLFFNFMRLKVSEGKGNARKRLCQCSFNVASLFRNLDSIHTFLSLPLEPRTKKSLVRVAVEICMRNSVFSLLSYIPTRHIF